MNVPRRPGIEIRPPDRANKSEEVRPIVKESSDTPSEIVSLRQPTPTQKMEFVVYTNVGKCSHSRELLDMLQKKGIKFEHTDVSNMSQIPSWMKGTPIIIHQGKGYCGDGAFTFVECLADAIVEESAEKQGGVVPSTIAKNVGCGIAHAFAPPKDESDDAKYTSSTEDAMKRLTEGRR